MKRSLIFTMAFLFTGSTAVFLAGEVEATEDNSTGSGHITFTGDYSDVGIRDPENPSVEVDAGNSPSTQGKLRIDFVPQFQFTSMNKISDKDMTYSVNAQLFNDETGPRGNFIQVSDYRGAMLGWTLQLRQEMQFQNSQTANSQLDGAVLSLDYSWTNSTQDANLSPTISKEVIHLDNIGSTYNLAEAQSGTGAGTWSISFGGSEENSAGIANTLKPKVDPNGNAMLDASFENKQMHENSAITLSVPGGTKKDPVSYSTVLTWILAELP